MKEKPAERATAKVNKSKLIRYRALRALGVFTLPYPGVPLRSTPGFMLSPRFAGSRPSLVILTLGGRLQLPEGKVVEPEAAKDGTGRFVATRALQDDLNRAGSLMRAEIN